MTTVLTDSGDFTVDASPGLRLTAADTERVSGWALKPEGMCRGPVCVKFPADERVDVAAFWRHIGNPVVSDKAGEVWALGTGAEDRTAGLTGLMAPDITLPDLAGTPHSLSALRGRKVLLTTWASW